ncbi:YdeI/OmpD-associated family protein [Nonomuraea sp. B10E15]|uniref:YdeI/OmpD-associated family protein n=1 Tax=Nonomuraea sp. B10E15 TaxID=3153560 RepID=UPI00325ECE3F
MPTGEAPSDSNRAACDRLARSRRREHVLAVESAKKPETRVRRIEKALAVLRDRDRPCTHGSPGTTVDT